MFKHNLGLNGMALGLSLLFSLALQHLFALAYKGWMWMGLAFFLLFMVANLFSVQRVKQPDFTAYLLFNLSLKLLTAFLAIGLCAFLFRALFPAFALHLVLYFLSFTAFEIRFVYLLVQQREQSFRHLP